MDIRVRCVNVVIAILAVLSVPADAGSPVAEDPAFREAWAAFQAREVHRPHALDTASRQRGASAATHVTSSRRPTWHADSLASGTPRDICRAVRQRVTYRSDDGDVWQTGQETWERGAGDCEDFAATVRDICRARRLDADIFVFRADGEREAHAATIGTWHGTMWISSNGAYAEIESLDAARRQVASEMGWGSDVSVFLANQRTQLTPCTSLLN